MEPYSSLSNTEGQDDEPYYRTIVCNPEDIICLGSDEEETAEETRRKRLRYEAQARRYMRGHRPVLLSASLRGPFSKESGWVNPWARPSRRKQNENRPQPALEVVTFTRSKLAEKSSSSHGYGYVNPEAVLAWQAKVGSVERSIDEAGHTHGEDEPSISTPYDERSKVAEGADSEARPDDSMRNHYTKTPHMDNDVDLNSRGTKRAVDFQWLKGSYVSKRARWDGPALSSPTPGPDSLGVGARERRHASTGVAEQGSTNIDRPKSTIHVSQSSLDRPRETPVVENPLRDNTIFSAQIESRRNGYPATRGTLFSSSMQMTSLPQLPVEDEEIDELQHNSQESRTSSRKSSGRKLRRSLNKSLNPSSSDLEQDDLIVITPHSKDSSTSRRSNSHMKVESLKLPKLPRPSIASDFGEDSFVSEIAPSSRNLEKFHFKKRKRRTKSAEHEQVDGGQDEALISERRVNPLPDDDSPPPDKESMPVQLIYVEDTENIVPEFEVAAENASTPSNTSFPAQICSFRPENHSYVEDARDDTGIRLTDALESLLQDKKSSTPPSEPQRSPVGDGGRSLDNGEGDMSFNIGEMSFLRAVLRAGGSGSNTPFSKPELTSDLTETPAHVLDEEKKGQDSDYLSRAIPNVSERNAPNSTEQRQPRKSLSSQRAISSRDFDKREGQGLNHISPSENSISHQRSSSPSSQKILLLSQRTIASNSQGQEDRQIPAPHSESSKSSSQRHAPNSSHSQLSPVPMPSQGSKISIDPNDISTQSYSTTPVKSQRSVRQSQSTGAVKSPPIAQAEESLAYDEPVPNVEQDEMDKIQLELSQVCPSSTSESDDRSDDEDDSDDDLDQLGQPHVKLRATPTSTIIKDNDPCGITLEQGVDYQGSTGSEQGENLVLSGAEELMTGIGGEEAGKVSPDLLSEDDVSESDAHVQTAGTKGKSNEPERGAEEASEASWEGCGPQSPWAVEHIEPIPLAAASDADIARPFGPLDPEDDSVEELHESDTSAEWQRIEQPRTPENSDIAPLRGLIRPTESPERAGVDLLKTLTSTQLLIHAATSNPWGSSLKKPSSIKIKKQTGKRVSFDGLSSQHSEDEPPLQIKFGPVSPPPPTMSEEEGMIDTGITDGTKVIKHFKRQFTRILPENVASPLNSSPALGAQAEAFIAADRETSIEQVPTTALHTPTRHLTPRSEPNSDIVWKHQDETDSQGTGEGPPVRTSLASFDMEDALGEMGNFLEDWSVDTELKQARASSPEKREECTGYRRRKLFGLV